MSKAWKTHMWVYDHLLRTHQITCCGTSQLCKPQSKTLVHVISRIWPATRWKVLPSQEPEPWSQCSAHDLVCNRQALWKAMHHCARTKSPGAKPRRVGAKFPEVNENFPVKVNRTTNKPRKCTKPSRSWLRLDLSVLFKELNYIVLWSGLKVVYHVLFPNSWPFALLNAI